MAQIRAIFWDVGGVLLTNGWDTTERHAVLNQFGLDAGDIEQFEHLHPGPNDQWEKGEITVNEYLSRTLFTEPRSFTSDEFVAAMKAQSRVLPDGAMPMLHAIAKAGIYKVVMLNNEAAELNDFRIEKFGFRDQFVAFCSSCYVGLRKPDPKIFQRGTQIMQVEPEESVFIDDREGNIKIAVGLGMQGVQFTTPDALVKELKSLGVDNLNLSGM